MNWRIPIVMLCFASACMAVDVAKTVKPAGGGDFTTIQAAIDWAKTNVFTPTNLIVECYTGGDLGSFTLLNQGWFPKPASITIRAATGNVHNGKVPTTGCYLNVPNNNYGGLITYGWSVPVLIQRLSVITTNGSQFGLGVDGDYGANNITFDGNLVYHVGTSADRTTEAIFFYYYEPSTMTNIVVRNNVVYGGATTNYGTGIFGEVASDADVTFQLYNNTVQGCQYGTRWVTNKWFMGDSIIRIKEVNDIATSCRTCFTWRVTSAVSSNNLSSDATADDGGGSGHLINKPASDQFESPISDFNLLTTADAKNAGKSISSFSTDARGVTRPQGPSWDIGALEFPYPVSRRRLPVFSTIMGQ